MHREFQLEEYSILQQTPIHDHSATWEDAIVIAFRNFMQYLAFECWINRSSNLVIIKCYLSYKITAENEDFLHRHSLLRLPYTVSTFFMRHFQTHFVLWILLHSSPFSTFKFKPDSDQPVYTLTLSIMFNNGVFLGLFNLKFSLERKSYVLRWFFMHNIIENVKSQELFFYWNPSKLLKQSKLLSMNILNHLISRTNEYRYKFNRDHFFVGKEIPVP